ncbi:MAG TPA: pirin family protein, partial [Kofleriaceae bacterium]|nr:pirin family protein [Kofleriaceae bacterium]
MQHYRFAIFRELNVELDRRNAELDGAPKSSERIFLMQHRNAAVSDHHRLVLAGQERVRHRRAHVFPLNLTLMLLDRRRFLVGSAASTLLLACQKSAKTATLREVDHVVAAQASRDGAGVALRRSIGSGVLPNLDPFLLLDEMHSSDPADYVAGFPQHPHRGFETVSYVLRGGFQHRDSVGNSGLIADGG